jgi:hypothetical protein
MAKKTQSNVPLNFIDLRKSNSKARPQLIQDIIQPELKRRWFLGLSILKRLSRTHLLFSIIILIVIIAVGLKLFIPAYDPVPNSVQLAVNFQIYYPDQSKLPIGYTLEVHSFSASNQAVVYAIRNNLGQTLSVSVQSRPSAAQMSYFNTSIIALHTSLNTSIGTALIGAINSQTVVSLPVNKSWILITAPGDISQSKLKQVIESFKK